MKGMLRILMSVTALALTLYLVTGSGLSEAWAKGPGGGHGTTSGITQPGNTQGSPGASSGNNAQDSKSGKGTKQKDQPTENIGFNYGGIKWTYGQ